MSRWGELTPATILQIAHEIREGTADPDDARRLIEMFCQSNADNLPAELLEHLRSAFSAYLTSERNIESALGLVTKKGRRKADEKIRLDMAVEILDLRLKGEIHQNSLAKISETFGRGERIIGKAWAGNKREALNLLLLERWEDHRPWTPDEIKRLREIFEGEPWLDEIKFLAAP